LKIGILGCGVISGIYIESAQKFANLECVAVADINPAAARFRADQYGIPRALTPDQLMADQDVELVVNLTPNRLHAEAARQILAAGKHLYGEQPLTVYRAEAQELLAMAAARGLRIGGAPDTFLGGAGQTARAAIDAGTIGEPFAATATLHWRRPPASEAEMVRAPSPTRATAPGSVSFFQTDGFKYGVTVAFDMGPYYLHAMINLLGPVRRIVGRTRKVFDEAPRMDGVQKVEAPTHHVGILEFASGVLCQYLTSSDIYPTHLPHLEIHGTEGSLRYPDPNNFPGHVFLQRPENRDPVEIDCRHGYNQNSRGLGVADMAAGIVAGRPHRASGEMAAHVVDIVNAIHESSDSGTWIELTTTCDRPAPLPAGAPDWTIPD
jgi:predicted dehydrogenase